MLDRKSRLVPISQISDFDLEMDAFVRAQVAEAIEENARIKAFKSKSFDECYAWLDLVAEKYGKTRGGLKGNVTFPSYDGSEQIRIAVQDSLTFGPELQIAKDLIDECLNEWSEGANENLRAIILDAFAVDKEGQLNTGRILSLRRIKIDDPRWHQAMEAISESLQVAVSKTYINFRRKNADGKLVNIPIDIAAV
ncbi:sulfate transporter [Yersinia rohdei]|nr:sulfate transporter [Yersinia rohdei]